jgi:methylated-DNA-[protein]-cysteine S-methyltransferase
VTDTAAPLELIDALRTAHDHPSATDGRLHARLVEQAEQAGILDIAYRTVDSPIGSLLLAATPVGLVRVAFDREGYEAVLAQLAVAISPRVLQAPRRLDRAASQLEEYFAGRRRVFELPVDLQLARGFRRAVLAHLQAIPYGTTESYAGVAKASGNPGAVRAAASACSHNPVPLVVPCHRVVRTDGSVGGYRGGVDAKHALLALESAGPPGS